MGILDGKKGLVFGVANHRSYAFHISKSIIDQGGQCAFTTFPDERLESRVVAAVEELGVENPWIKPCDATKDEDLDKVFEQYGNDFDQLDFVIHSIAFAEREWLAPGKFVETPRASFQQALDISAYTLVAMANRARPLMAKGDGGTILSMSYFGAEKVVRGYNVMGVAKSALECATRYLAHDLGRDGIRVNSISGGPLKTLAASGIHGFREIFNVMAERAPLGRNVKGWEVGGTAAFLISDLGTGITGETLHVDCGASVVAG